MNNIIVKLIYDGRYFSNVVFVKYDDFKINEEKYKKLLVEKRQNGTYNGDTISVKYFQTDNDYNFILNEIFQLDKTKIIS